MPSFDISRSRFRLADEHVIVLCALATGNEVPDELTAAQKELFDCGLVDEDGKLSAALLPLMETVLSPGVVISLEAAGRQGKLHHGMLIGADHVVAHETWPGVTEAEYSLVEPKTLVWKLSDMVNLQKSPVGPDTAPSPVETTIGTVEAGLAVLEGEGLVRSAHDERAAIRQALATGGDLGEQALTLVADLISELRSSWRLTSAWQTRHEGRDAAATRGFAVWDCGPLGYWLRELPAEPVPEERITPASTFRLVRVEAKTIWTRITGLLPDQDELRHAAAQQPRRG
ncbi:histidine kinase [Streptomyces sp. IB2014 016-6]|uniref:histidine kinase n=1 Tax=Streptomyces sp. IB2014 016-6 TaxID=2517818 RepID=UPI0011C7BEBA|nr:histidine kinase [Streptomyces sp. IB2014 016-6]TXL90301.1 histidine kinase [Streptomyces sp. IB2014 016-6]